MKIPAAHRWQTTDTFVCLFVVVVFFWLLYEAGTALNYIWHWSLPLEYIATHNKDGWHGGLLLDGMLISVRLMIFSGILALLIGGIVTAAALSPVTALRLMAKLYVESLRHLPPIVFIFIFFYFVSSQIFTGEITPTDNTISRLLFGDPAQAENFISGVLCLAIFEAAFVTEILRAGVLSIERGQWNAARSMGLSSWHTLRLVILPQATARTAAPLTGQLILLVKDSAILSVISVQELTFSAQETAVSTQQIFETWLLAAVFYFMLCWPLLFLARRLQLVRE
ncbi:amino acid ABC transporter permease [Candidatus Persebacteraceae bacterium Df01]|jgi:polar amino acid transport system permease protein|uniref:Amino acid ABC transporter permease n=1 Tax=Candidatus Doriopsillibacter californiensis TaxID=2970740 RepID=A0ABT7QK40_9GAMM|nr:amino acid ABC transporter permease [Candidatus Persebacteraceae bacterium Df01]